MDPPSNRRGVFKFFPIVVAIIAVLVAIAVPLFVGQLDKAQEATFNANKRAVRGAVVSLILKDGITFDDEAFFTAEVDKTTGEIKSIKKDTTKSDETKDYKEWQESDSGEIVVKITTTDLTITGLGD